MPVQARPPPVSLRDLTVNLYCSATPPGRTDFDEWWAFDPSEQDVAAARIGPVEAEVGFCNHPYRTKDLGLLPPDGSNHSVPATLEGCAQRCLLLSKNCSHVSVGTFWPHEVAQCITAKGCAARELGLADPANYVLSRAFRSANVTGTQVEDWTRRAKLTNGLSAERALRWAPLDGPALRTFRPSQLRQCLRDSWIFVAGDSVARDFYWTMRTTAGMPTFAEGWYPRNESLYWPWNRPAIAPLPCEVSSNRCGVDERGVCKGLPSANTSCTRDEWDAASRARLSFQFIGTNADTESFIRHAEGTWPVDGDGDAPPSTATASASEERGEAATARRPRFAAGPTAAFVSCAFWPFLFGEHLYQPNPPGGGGSGTRKRRAADKFALLPEGLDAHDDEATRGLGGNRTSNRTSSPRLEPTLSEHDESLVVAAAGACARYIDDVILRRWPSTRVFLLGLPDHRPQLKHLQEPLRRRIDAALGIHCEPRLGDGDAVATGTGTATGSAATAKGTSASADAPPPPAAAHIGGTGGMPWRLHSRRGVVPLDRYHIGRQRTRDGQHPVTEVQAATVQFALGWLCSEDPRGNVSGRARDDRSGGDVAALPLANMSLVEELIL